MAFVFVTGSRVWAMPLFRCADGDSQKKTHQSTKLKGRTKVQSRAEAKAARAKAKAEARAKAEMEAVRGKKVAIFVFEGEDTDALRRHVVRLFKLKRMQVLTALRPVDTPEQYRDMAYALDLAVYVHGKIRDRSRDEAVFTISVRSAFSGRRMTTISMAGSRQSLIENLEENLWRKASSALAKACADAARPNRPHNPPMRIEAGTPL